MTVNELRSVEEMGYPVDDFHLPESGNYWTASRAKIERMLSHPECNLAGIEDLLVWVPPSRMDEFPMRCFYDGDYSDVLEIDDPCVTAALLRINPAPSVEGPAPGSRA